MIRKMRRTLPDVAKINTRILEQIVNSSDARTEYGTDYGPIAHEIQDELYRRQSKHGAIMQAKQERAQFADFEAIEAHAKRCTQCQALFPLANIDAHFSKVSGAKHRYRSHCKTCIAKKTAERRATANIDIPF